MPQANEWQLQEAKNKLSELVRRCQEQSQTITLHGQPAAVVLSFAEYRALLKPRTSLAEVMRTAPHKLQGLVLEPRSDRDYRGVDL